MNAHVERLAAGLERGERRALGRRLSLIENGEPDELRAIVAEIHPRAGHARILGVTGSPGAGKSTVTNAITTEIRSRERSIAILAVDPSSPFSGGALLGDRVRMQRHHADNEVFIRSMASRGHLGDLAFTTPQAVLAIGKDEPRCHQEHPEIVAASSGHKAACHFPEVRIKPLAPSP